MKLWGITLGVALIAIAAATIVAFVHRTPTTALAAKLGGHEGHCSAVIACIKAPGVSVSELRTRLTSVSTTDLHLSPWGGTGLRGHGDLPGFKDVSVFIAKGQVTLTR